MIEDIEDLLDSIRYKLTTVDKNQNKVIVTAYYYESKFKDAKKAYDNEVALHHNVDNDRVTITLFDMDENIEVYSYDSDFDNI